MKRIIGMCLVGLLLGISHAAAWECQYHEDFSVDPSWVTNDPSNFYWTGQEYHGKQTDGQDQYAYKLLSCDYQGGSFRMEFEVKPNIQWAGNIDIGLVGPSMRTFTCGSLDPDETTIHVTFAVDSHADHVMLITNDDNGVCRHTDWWTSFPLQGAWYRCVVEYDCWANSACFSVSLLDGGWQYEETLFDLGEFTELDRFAWSGVGDHGYAGRYGEGLLDNVEISYDSECGPCEVAAICQDDKICHFEGDLCGGHDPRGRVGFGPGACGQGLWTHCGWVVLGDAVQFSRPEFTVEFHVLFEVLPRMGDHAAGLVTKYKNHLPHLSEWGVWVEGNRAEVGYQPVWMLTGDGTDSILSEPGLLETGVVYHVRAIWYGDYAELWVDGELVLSWELNRNSTDTPTPVVIGNSASGENTFCGMIDELRIGCIGPGPVATIDIEPNTLNLKSKGKYVTCHIELSDGYDPADIDVSTVVLNNVLHAELWPTSVGDHDADGIPDRMVKFDRDALIDLLGGTDGSNLWLRERGVDMSPLSHGQEREITVSGELSDRTRFSGKDSMRVTCPGEDQDGIAALHVRPSVVSTAATVSYELPANEPVSLKVFDAAGRLVRTLANGHVAAGRHDLIWDRRTDDGRFVGSGIYFIRLQRQGDLLSAKAFVIR